MSLTAEKVENKIARKEAPRIFITIVGGLVQAIESDTEIDVIICDFDTQGIDESVLSEINGDEAYIYDGHVGVDKEAVDTLFKKVEGSHA